MQEKEEEEKVKPEDYHLLPGEDKEWLDRIRRKQGKKSTFEEHLNH